MLRPRPTTWFDLLTGRDQFALAMQTLAASGAAQLEAKPLTGSEPVLPRLDGFFAAFAALEEKFGPYWPAARGDAGLVLENPIEALDETQARLASWARRADPLVAELRAADARLSEIDLIARLVAAVPDETPLHRLSEVETRRIDHAIWYLPDPDAEAPEVDAVDEVLTAFFPTDDGAFVVALAEPGRRDALESQMAELRATPVPLPDFLHAVPDSRTEQVRTRRGEVATRRAAAQVKLDALAAETRLEGLLSRVAVLDWLRDNSGDIRATRHMMQITGWTYSSDGAAIDRALAEAGVDYVLTLGDTAPADPPMVLENPSPVRAFEFFPRLLGVPASDDVDPSAFTALIAPLLFGFMFGDVGQGAVLMIAGVLLAPRLPVFALFIPGGAAAIVFGFLFGSVFSVEGVIPALWLHPLHEPITLLAVAIVLGAILLLLGIALDVLQALWHRRAAAWLRTNGGLTLAYLGLLGAWFVPTLAWALAVGFGLTFAFAREDGNWSTGAAGKAAAEFVEAIMRLAVATVSFTRVGAFALAHAGLSAAVVGMAEALGGIGFWIALLLGNALILTLEGLVTGIQTTRLILFEFYIRFFRAEGREFHPLAAPRPAYNKGLTP